MGWYTPSEKPLPSLIDTLRVTVKNDAIIELYKSGEYRTNFKVADLSVGHYLRLVSEGAMTVEEVIPFVKKDNDIIRLFISHPSEATYTYMKNKIDSGMFADVLCYHFDILEPYMGEVELTARQWLQYFRGINDRRLVKKSVALKCIKDLHKFKNKSELRSILEYVWRYVDNETFFSTKLDGKELASFLATQLKSKYKSKLVIDDEFYTRLEKLVFIVTLKAGKVTEQTRKSLEVIKTHKDSIKNASKEAVC